MLSKDGLEELTSMTLPNTRDIQVNYTIYLAALVAEYFSDPAVRKMYALNDEIEFGAQSDKVYKALFTDFMRDEVHLVEYCLSKKLPVLIYNGQNDIIVENPGTMRWVEQLHHPDGQKFR